MSKAPEKFVVGETVARYVGEDSWGVTVVAVEGDVVTIEDGHRTITYQPRNDGKHVTPGTPDFAVMPDMIYHPKPVVKKPATFWQHLTGAKS